MKESQASAGLASALLFGIIGFAAGLLFAPKSGRETREQLRRKSDEMRNRANTAKDKATEKLNEVKSSASQTAERARRSRTTDEIDTSL